MDSENAVVLALAAVGGVVLVIWVATHFFSEEAKRERRRRRSNAPIASKNHRRPSIKFSVRTKNRRRK